MENSLAGHVHDGAFCEDGWMLYLQALDAGKISRVEAEVAPCLLGVGALHADPRNPGWLRPTSPFVALEHLRQPLEREIRERWERRESLVKSFEPLLARAKADPHYSVHQIEGPELIGETISHAIANCREEMLTIQPTSSRPPKALEESARQTRALVEREVSVRHLYQRPMRYNFNLRRYYLEAFRPGQLQVRTVNQIVERTIVLDRAVAFISTDENSSPTLQVSSPLLIRYLAHVFEVLWAGGAPLERPLASSGYGDQLTPARRNVAELLIEGYPDKVIANRLGIHVRTCRSHVAKLMELVGAGSRTQLGYRIAQAGFLDQAQ
ncbi:LuxR C-terminal-related transcriptional regulator [Streptomyces sp. NPDC021218]|uniref:helix-turn-helix transcriptional regulator n=1 Tax=Streptomyces sp. NPDC021218 TaxID=3365119 RepID=UPI00378CF65F